jgi:hypothetical protein
MTTETETTHQANLGPVSNLPPNLGVLLLEPLNHGLAAAERQALKMGVPAHDMINLLLNHLASVCAMIEPPQAREALIKDLVSSFSVMVRKHVEARFTTPGGLLLPGIGP